MRGSARPSLMRCSRGSDFMTTGAAREKSQSRGTKDPKNIEAIIEPSPQQAAMMLYQGGDEGQAAGFLDVSFELAGELDPDAWRFAWEEMLRRQDALRMSVEAAAGRPMLVVWRELALPWRFEDLRRHPSDRQREFLEEYRRSNRTEGLALDAPPVTRVATFQLEPKRYQVFWSCHHLFLDGWSSSSVVRDVLALYEARVAGEALPPAPQTTYRSYRQRVDALDPEVGLRFWREHLEGYDDAQAIAARRLAFDAVSVREVALTLASDTARALDDQLRERGLTASLLARAAWAQLLASLLKSERVVFGAVVSGRVAEVEGVDSIAGFLSNVIPVRAHVDPEKSWVDRLDELRSDQFRSQPYEHLSLGEIGRAAGWRGVPFDSLLLVQNLPLGWSDQARTLQIRQYRSPTTTTYPLTVTVFPSQSWRTVVQYDRRRFERRWVETLLEAFHTVIERIAKDPDAPVAATGSIDVPATPDVEREEGAPASALPTATLTESPVIAGFSAPRNKLEMELAALWGEILETGPIGARDDFFALGGTSMQAVRLFVELERRFGRRLALARLLENPTVEKLAVLLRGDTESPEFRCLVPIEVHDGTPNLFCIHAGGGHVLFYRDFARAMGPDVSVYGIQPVGIDGEEKPLRTIEEIAGRYLAEIRLLQPEGPYRLLGYCWGATVAFEMARQLAVDGVEPPQLILVDSSAPRAATRPFIERFGIVLKMHLPFRRRHLLKLFADPADKLRLDQEILQNLCEDAFLAYKPRPYAGPALFMQGGDSESWDRRYWEKGLVEDWLEIMPNLQVERFDSNHDEFFTEGHSERTAERVLGYLVDRRSSDR